MVNIAYKIGQRMGLGPYDLDRLRLLALLHDIGKIGIPENILFKAEPLTEEDWKIIKNHPNIGYRIAKISRIFPLLPMKFSTTTNDGTVKDIRPV